MKLSDLLTGLASLDARTGAIEVARRHRGQPQGQAAAMCSSRCRAPRPTGLRFAAQAAAAGAAADRRRGRAAGAAAGRAVRARSTMRGARSRCWPRGFYPRQPQVIAAVTGTSGKTSVAAFTRQIWAALGYEAASVGTIGVVTPQARGLWLADHARSGRPARTLVGTGRRGRHASRDRGVVARPRPAPARRRARRGRRLHQSQPRSSRLSSERRGLSRRQAPAVRSAGRPTAAAR